MADISYTRTTWADGSDGGTPIDATKLNNIEQGIVDAVAAIGPNDTTQDGTLKAQIDALGEPVSLTVTRTAEADVTIHNVTAYQCGAVVMVSIQLSTTVTGNSKTLVTLSGIPAPKIACFTALASGSSAQGVQLMPDKTIRTSGGSFAGGAWLGGTFVYLA